MSAISSHASSDHFVSSDLEQESDISILRQTLRRSAILTSSSFTNRLTSNRLGTLEHAQIGEGLQGAVFEQVGESFVFKKETPGNEIRATSLAREYRAHAQIWLSFQRYEPQIKSQVLVPHPISFIPSTEASFWDQHLPRFPEDYRTKTAIAKMERILPLPRVVRKALVSHFYPLDGDGDDHKTTSGSTESRDVLSQTTNKHCLVRTYLGKKKQAYKREDFSLRNFPLCLESMQKFDIDVGSLARHMGKAYAMIQWGAGYNGDDVEFVLGTVEKEEEDDGTSSLQIREVRLWLLDFGQCEAVNLQDDPETVYQLFRGTLVTGDNQWFIPHCKRDAEIFKDFREGYIEAGNAILRDKGLTGRFNMIDFMNGYEEYAEDFLTTW